MPIVPQLDPVEKAVAAARRNTIAGTRPGASVSPRRSVSHSAVPRTSFTSESAHASTRITIASSIAFIPAYHASSACSSERMRCPTERPTATSTDSSDAHIIARYESAVEMISRIDSPSPVAKSPPTTPTTSTMIGMMALSARAGVSSCGVSTLDSFSACSITEPGR